MICDKDHQDVPDISPIISSDQGGNGRHKCCGCAYNKGYALGYDKIENFNLKKELARLPDNQKALLGHFSPIEFFMRGYIEGRKQAIEQ